MPAPSQPPERTRPEERAEERAALLLWRACGQRMVMSLISMAIISS